MKIILEQPLIKHMNEEGLSDLVVEIGPCIACGGSYKNVNARFAEPGETFSEEEYEVRETELGKVYLPKEHIEYGDSLRFVWKSYYWMDGLGVAGAKAINE